MFIKQVLSQAVVSRAVKARAMQFKYQEDTQATLSHVRTIETSLGVEIHCANDQGALFCHLELDRFYNRILKEGDWVVVDAFKKVSVVSAEDFKVYYEPGE